MSSIAQKFYDEIEDSAAKSRLRISTSHSKSSTRSKSSKASNTKFSKPCSTKSSKTSIIKSSKASNTKFSKPCSTKSSKTSIIKSSKANSTKSSIVSSRNKFNGKPTRSIVIKKEREINKIIPQGANKTVINEFKSKETLLKKQLTDIGSNTVLSGPHVCKATCKWQKRTISKETVETKQVQTLDIKPYAHLDKACTHYIETASFGMVTIPITGRYSENTIRTRPRSSCYKYQDMDMDIQSSVSKGCRSAPNRERKLSSEDSCYHLDQPRKSYQTSKISFSEPQQLSREFRLVYKESQNSKSNHYGSFINSNTSSYVRSSSERWALSPFPVRGPDF